MIAKLSGKLNIFIDDKIIKPSIATDIKPSIDMGIRPSISMNNRSINRTDFKFNKSYIAINDNVIAEDGRNNKSNVSGTRNNKLDIGVAVRNNKSSIVINGVDTRDKDKVCIDIRDAKDSSRNNKDSKDKVCMDIKDAKDNNRDGKDKVDDRENSDSMDNALGNKNIKSTSINIKDSNEQKIGAINYY